MAREFVQKSTLPALYVTFANDWQLFFIKPQGLTASEAFARRYFPYRIYSIKNNGTTDVDSLFKASFYAGLSRSGFATYSDSDAVLFLADERKKFVVEVVQMYIEESSQLVTDTLFFDVENFVAFDTVITRIDLSIWLRINPLDDSLTASPLLFAGLALTDFLSGSWSYNVSNDSYQYSYTFLPVEMEDVYSFFTSSGNTLSGYVYDYFLNLFLNDRLKNKPNVYYTWNKHYLKPAGYDRFIFMKQ